MQKYLPVIFFKPLPVKIKTVLLLLIFWFTRLATYAQIQPPNNIPGDCGQTLQMDGVNEYVSVPYSAALNSPLFSVSLWVKVTGYTTDFRGIVTSRDAPGGNLRGWTLYQAPDNTLIVLASSNTGSTWTTISSSSVVPLNTWTHIVFLYDGTDLKLYADGVLQGSAANTGYVSNSNRAMRIGAAVTEAAPQYFFKGQFDELTLWNRGLTDQEVTDLYLGSTIGTSGLQAYYDFNGENNSSTLTDRTGNGHTGTLNNMEASADWVQTDGTGAGVDWYADADADGYAKVVRSCTSPGVQYSTTFGSFSFGDCDDNDVNMNPGQSEIQGNSIDDDCNPFTYDTRPFIATWKTFAGDNSITIPTSGSYSYSYYVDWGDGSTDLTLYTGDATHFYATADTFTISVSKNFPAINFNNSPRAPDILTIEQWGDMEWQTMQNAFYGCKNLILNATDVPDLDDVEDMSNMFRLTKSIGNADLSAWNVSNVITMNGMFQSSYFNGAISSWNVGAVADMTNMFEGAKKFNQDISGWDIYNVTSMVAMFSEAASFNYALGNWQLDGSGSLDLTRMFDYSGLSIPNYESTLAGWAAQIGLPTGKTLGVVHLRYCDETNRNALINNKGWTISGDQPAVGITPNEPNLLPVFSQGPVASLTAPVATSCTDGQITATTTTVFPITVSTRVVWTYTDTDPNTPDVQQYQYVYAGAQRPFITTWKTSSVNESIVIPTNPNDDYIYSYTVDWGDGTTDDTVRTGDAAHIYAQDGTYNVSVSGTFPGIYFAGAPGQIQKIHEVVQWGDIQWETMEHAFYLCDRLKITATDFPNLNNVTSMQNMFGNTRIGNPDLSSWDVSNVSNMNHLFGFSDFNGDISSWNVSKVTNMSNMFYYDYSFNQDLSSWDVSKVTAMSFMFYNNYAFNKDLNNWDVSKVTDMSSMFYGASSFNKALNDWDVSAVINMSYMFQYASSFNQDLSNWDVSEVTNMNVMFYDASSFNQDIGDWDVSAVTKMNYMFYGATAFNRDLGNWDVSKVVGMQSMFFGAARFNQSLGTWQLDSLEYAYDMLSNTSLSIPNYESTLEGWASQGNLPDDIPFGAQGLHYCDETFRNMLLNDHDWNITGDQNTGDFIVDVQTLSAAISENPITSLTAPTATSCATGTIAGVTEVAFPITQTTIVTWLYLEIDGVSGDTLNRLEQDQYVFVGRPFVTTWQAHANGSGLSNCVSIPVDFSYSESTDIMIDWGDGEIEYYSTANNPFSSHRYADENQTYEISIYGKLPHIYYQTSEMQWLRSIEQWGDIGWKSMEYSFALTTNLDYNASDVPDLQNVTSLRGMFMGSSFNGDVSGWNVSNVFDMNRMFNDATSFNQNLGVWNISNVSNMTDMLSNTALSRDNYEATLNGWVTLDAGESQVPSYIDLGAEELLYCDTLAHYTLIHDYTWTINDDTHNCSLLLEDIDDQSVVEETAWSISVSATYIGSGTVVYSLDNTSLSKGITVNPATGELSWTPTHAQLGAHTVSIMATDGETTRSITFTITVTIPSEISASTESNSIKVYPNPSQGAFRIMLNTNSPESYLIHIYDMLGTTVFESLYVEYVDLKNLPKGVYLIKIENGKKDFVEQLVIY